MRLGGGSVGVWGELLCRIPNTDSACWESLDDSRAVVGRSLASDGDLLGKASCRLLGRCLHAYDCAGITVVTCKEYGGCAGDDGVLRSDGICHL